MINTGNLVLVVLVDDAGDAWLALPGQPDPLISVRALMVGWPDDRRQRFMASLPALPGVTNGTVSDPAPSSSR